MQKWWIVSRGSQRLLWLCALLILRRNSSLALLTKQYGYGRVLPLNSSKVCAHFVFICLYACVWKFVVPFLLIPRTFVFSAMAWNYHDIYQCSCGGHHSPISRKHYVVLPIRAVSCKTLHGWKPALYVGICETKSRWVTIAFRHMFQIRTLCWIWL